MGQVFEALPLRKTLFSVLSQGGKENRKHMFCRGGRAPSPEKPPGRICSRDGSFPATPEDLALTSLEGETGLSSLYKEPTAARPTSAFSLINSCAALGQELSLSGLLLLPLSSGGNRPCHPLDLVWLTGFGYNKPPHIWEHYFFPLHPSSLKPPGLSLQKALCDCPKGKA